MLTAIVVSLLLHAGGAPDQTARSGALWEEIPQVQLNPGYHPMIRFGSWDTARFNRSMTYMFATKDLIQQGQFSVQGNHYYFRAVMANEIENADVDRLVADMDPKASQGFRKAYAKSMINFEGSYDKSTGTLSISYPVDGQMRFFSLHDTTEGDEQRASLGSAAERALVGFWQARDPFPGKMDARSRTKFEEQGLPRFFGEASASEGAQFSPLDLRKDKTFRSHQTIGAWSRDGSVLWLESKGKRTPYQISDDGSKLLTTGQVAYVR